ncbi:hypothetical protein WI664_02070, partial [Vibrio cholerae]
GQRQAPSNTSIRTITIVNDFAQYRTRPMTWPAHQLLHRQTGLQLPHAACDSDNHDHADNNQQIALHLSAANESETQQSARPTCNAQRLSSPSTRGAEKKDHTRTVRVGVRHRRRFEFLIMSSSPSTRRALTTKRGEPTRILNIFANNDRATCSRQVQNKPHIYQIITTLQVGSKCPPTTGAERLLQLYRATRARLHPKPSTPHLTNTRSRAFIKPSKSPAQVEGQESARLYNLTHADHAQTTQPPQVPQLEKRYRATRRLKQKAQLAVLTSVRSLRFALLIIPLNITCSLIVLRTNVSIASIGFWFTASRSRRLELLAWPRHGSSFAGRPISPGER